MVQGKARRGIFWGAGGGGGMGRGGKITKKDTMGKTTTSLGKTISRALNLSLGAFPEDSPGRRETKKDILGNIVLGFRSEQKQKFVFSTKTKIEKLKCSVNLYFFKS